MIRTLEHERTDKQTEIRSFQRVHCVGGISHKLFTLNVRLYWILTDIPSIVVSPIWCIPSNPLLDLDAPIYTYFWVYHWGTPLTKSTKYVELGLFRYLNWRMYHNIYEQYCDIVIIVWQNFMSEIVFFDVLSSFLLTIECTLYSLVVSTCPLIFCCLYTFVCSVLCTCAVLCFAFICPNPLTCSCAALLFALVKSSPVL